MNRTRRSTPAKLPIISLGRLFKWWLVAALFSLANAVFAAAPNEPVEYIDILAKQRNVSAADGLLITGTDTLATPATFKPPVEITVVAMTDSQNLRLGYAADSLIFNWEKNPSELRVGGGPAGGKHKPGAGSIPAGQYVTIKWLVTPTKQEVYVDGELRYEHAGDYSRIDKPVSVFTHGNARVTVKSLTVAPSVSMPVAAAVGGAAPTPPALTHPVPTSPATAGGSSAAALPFKSPLAVQAWQRYGQALAICAQQFQRDLDAAMKDAMKFGKLDDANAIAEVLKQKPNGNFVPDDLKYPEANAARGRYHQAIVAVRKQYSRDLEASLHTAMVGGDIDEANSIQKARKEVDDALLAAGVGHTATALSTVGVPTKSGLGVQEYARQVTQTKDNGWCISPDDFGKPVGKNFTVRTLLGWKYDPERNAIATGFIEIEQDGEYFFNSNSNWDRNWLRVNGVDVCPARDGSATIGKILLKKGYVPILSAGMVENKGTVDVKWKPPGQAEMSEIPAKLLKH
jgi:hypothetical protein